MKGYALIMWRVYDDRRGVIHHALGGFIARCFRLRDNATEETPDVIRAASLEEMRKRLKRLGLVVCIARHPEDDAKIVETWI